MNALGMFAAGEAIADRAAEVGAQAAIEAYRARVEPIMNDLKGRLKRLGIRQGELVKQDTVGEEEVKSRVLAYLFPDMSIDLAKRGVENRKGVMPAGEGRATKKINLMSLDDKREHNLRVIACTEYWQVILQDPVFSAIREKDRIRDAIESLKDDGKLDEDEREVLLELAGRATLMARMKEEVKAEDWIEARVEQLKQNVRYEKPTDTMPITESIQPLVTYVEQWNEKPSLDVGESLEIFL